MKSKRLALGAAALIIVALCTGCNKLKARDQLNKGVLSYRNAQYAQAVDHFQQAVTLDPSLVNARLYLATALAMQYVPGGATPENLKVAGEAIKAYENVLQVDPTNTNAIGSIAQIYYNMRDFDKAKQFQQQLMKAEPNNPDPYYWIGVLDYDPALKNQMTLRTKLNLIRPNPKDHDSYPPLKPKDRELLASQNKDLVDEGMQMLQKAIDLKPNYANAYSYLNLLYRQKADIEESPEAREDDLKKADELAAKALALYKEAPHAANGGAA
ncbi:MAG: tetratricopeptide repeat protein [Acidobacteriota bacterium]|nr:tetratricopeptide repeat protein [Acidobacteriota bacterium]